MPAEASRFSDLSVAELAAPHKGSIKIGPFGSQLRKEEMVAEGVKVYGQENLIMEDWGVGERRVSKSKYLSLRSCELAQGDVVVTMMGTVGRCAIFPEHAEPGIMDSHLLRIQPNTTLVDRQYLKTVMTAEAFVGRQIGRLSHGTIMAGLSSSIVKRIRIPAPPVEQQRRIAAILDTLDDAIRSTEQVIAKLQQMKQGLLHDFLTRGVDENGEVRPSHTEAPHLYKDSPLGKIPTNWESTVLSAVVPRAEYGISSSLGDDGRIPVLRMNNLYGGEADISDLRFSNTPDAAAHLLQPGDVLFNRTNSIDHVGRTGIWRGQLPCASFASYLVRLVNDPCRITSEYLNRWLNLPQTQIRIRRYATPGVHQVNINPTNLRKTELALPRDVDEQERIGTLLLELDSRMGKERTLLDKVRAVRRGLLDDLLTGRVRVPSAEASS